MDRMTRRVLYACAATTLLGLATPALADGKTSSVSQVVVTAPSLKVDSVVATKTDTPLIERPQSVSLVSADQIDLEGAQSLGEALRYSGGVNPEQYGGVDQRIDWYMIRGFPTSAPYIDGLTSNTRR
jgi:outer membrane receptor protein involved in Fe transport